MGYDSYRPPKNVPARSNRSPRLSSGKTDSVPRSRDPRVKSSGAQLRRSEVLVSQIDDAGDDIEILRVPDIIKDAAESMCLSESVRREHIHLQAQLNQETQNKDNATQNTAHTVYIEQLEQRRAKTEAKLQEATTKLKESEDLTRDRITKATVMIMQLVRSASAKHENSVASLKHQLEIERTERQSEMALLRTSLEKQERTMSQMTSNMQAQPRIPVRTIEAEESQQLKRDAFVKEVSELSRKVQQYEEEIVGIRKDLHQSREDMEHLRELSSEQKLKMARMNDVFTDKSTAEALASHVNNLTEQIGMFEPGNYIKQNHFEVYVEKFNQHERNFTDFKTATGDVLKTLHMLKNYPEFMKTTEQNIQNLSTRLAQENAQLVKVNNDAAVHIESAKNDMISLKDEIDIVKARFDGIDRQMKGTDHAIISLNTRYNNFSSDVLVKRMTSIVDARRDGVNAEVIKLSDHVRSIQDNLALLKVGQAKSEKDNNNIQTNLSHLTNSSAQTENLIKEFKIEQTKLREECNAFKKELHNIMTTATEQSSLIETLRSSQTTLGASHDSIKTNLHNFSTAYNETVDHVQRLKDEFVDFIQERDIDLREMRKNLLAQIHRESQELRTGLEGTCDEFRIRQQIELADLIAQVTEAQNEFDRRLTEFERVYGKAVTKRNNLESGKSRSSTDSGQNETGDEVAQPVTASQDTFQNNNVSSSAVDTQNRPSHVSYQVNDSVMLDCVESSKRDRKDDWNNLMSDTVVVRRSPTCTQAAPTPDYYSRVGSNEAAKVDIVDLTSDDIEVDSSSQLLSKFGASTTGSRSITTPEVPSNAKLSGKSTSLKCARKSIENLKIPQKRKSNSQNSVSAPGNEHSKPSGKKIRKEGK